MVNRRGESREAGGRRSAPGRSAISRCAGEGFGVESLEARTLLFAWSADEVYLSELVNRARANPAAEGTRLGINLASGLTSAELARLVPQEPLALNQALTLAARAHSLDMATRNYFSHTSPSPEYSTPTSRSQAFGYPGTVGENIAAGYTSVDAVHRAWLESLGHRKNVLSLHSTFNEEFHYDELGVGLSFNAGGAYNHYFTQDFGYQGSIPVRYLLGVVFDDANDNNFYGIGEGAAGIRIDVMSGDTVVGTYTTDAAGNYQIGVAAGSYTVRFTSLETGNTFDRSATVTTYNVKVDAELEQIDPPAAVDDHADSGEWTLATEIAIDSDNGNGTQLGRFEAADDTDLFRFTASVAGVYHISVNALSANSHVLTVFNSAHTTITTTPGGQQNASFDLTAAAGQTFFLRVSGSIIQLNGNYVVLLEGPGPGGEEPPVDDHADSGEWSLATVIAIDPDTGDGTGLGQFEVSDDTDLFRFTASVAGVYHLAINALSSNSHVLTVFNGSQQQIAMTASGQADASYDLTAAAGQTFYMRVSGGITELDGSYAVLIVGPGPGDGEPLVDDHADSGEWSLATVMAIDPDNGNGTSLGRFEVIDDSDLFRFTASVAGVYQIAVNAISANQHVLTVFNASHEVVATTPAGQQSATYDLTAAAGQTFYLLISGSITQINGNYALLIEGPGEPAAPDYGHLAESSLPLGGAIMIDGRLGVSYLSADLRPMFGIRNEDGTWERIDLISEAGGPGVAGRVVTWSDDRDGSTYAAARSDEGLILYERGTDGTWTMRNLSTELGKAGIDGELTVFIENNGRAHIAGLTAAGKLVDYRMLASENGAGQWRWSFLNVTGHLTIRGRAMPTMAGRLESFVTPRGSWNVTGLDAAGDIQLFFKETGRRWDVVNLSEFVGTPVLTGDLSVMQGEDRSVRIAGVASNGNVWITGFTETDGWRATNGSAGKAVTKKMRGGGITTYVNDDGVAFIAGLNAVGKVVVYRYNAATSNWAASVPSNQVSGGGPRLVGALTATMGSDGLSVNIVGQTAAGRIIRYSWSPGGSWLAEDVSAKLAA